MAYDDKDDNNDDNNNDDMNQPIGFPLNLNKIGIGHQHREIQKFTTLLKITRYDLHTKLLGSTYLPKDMRTQKKVIKPKKQFK